MTSFNDDSVSLEFHSDSALLASLRALLNESRSTVQRCVVERLVSDERHERTLMALLDDPAAQVTEQFVELLVCAMAVVPLNAAAVPPDRCAALLCALFARLLAPAIQPRVTPAHLQRATAVLFNAADALLPHAAAAAVRCLAALRSFWPTAPQGIAAQTERWLALAVRSAADKSHSAVALCWAALRHAALVADDANVLAATLDCLAAQTALALSSGDCRLLRALLLAASELLAAPATPFVVERQQALARTWLDTLERARTAAEEAGAADAMRQLGKLIESAYAHLVRAVPQRDELLARLARDSAALEPRLAASVVARHALLCECLATPLQGATDDAAAAAAALDNVAFAHAALLRLGRAARPSVASPWRRASFAVSVWLTTTALHARGALGGHVEQLILKRALLSPSRVVAAAASGVWAFALRNGSPDYRKRQSELLVRLLERGGVSDERLAHLLARALSLVGAADAIRVTQCLERLPRLFQSPLRHVIAACSLAHLRPLPGDLPPYREPLAPAVVQVLQRCAAAPTSCARQHDMLVQWCVAALAECEAPLSGAAMPHNAPLVLDALAALAEVPRSGAPVTAPRLDAALRAAMHLARRYSERADVQLAVRRLLGACNAFVLSGAVFDGALSPLFRAVLAPRSPRDWLLDAASLAAFQRFAKFAADAARCQTLLTAESKERVVAHLNQKVLGDVGAPDAGELERRVARLCAAASDVGDAGDAGVRVTTAAQVEFASQLRELAARVESGRVRDVSETLRAHIAALLLLKDEQ